MTTYNDIQRRPPETTRRGGLSLHAQLATVVVEAQGTGWQRHTRGVCAPWFVHILYVFVWFSVYWWGRGTMLVMSRTPTEYRRTAECWESTRKAARVINAVERKPSSMPSRFSCGGSDASRRSDPMPTHRCEIENFGTQQHQSLGNQYNRLYNTAASVVFFFCTASDAPATRATQRFLQHHPNELSIRHNPRVLPGLCMAFISYAGN